MAWGQSPQFPLVIAANRDEWYARPTAPLASWTTASGQTIVAGRDLQDGGTWMGFAPNGRFAMLTNVRNPASPPPYQPTSRGGLVVDWLSSTLLAGDWAAQCEMAKYAGFNLLLGDWAAQSCHYLTNQYIDNRPEVQLNTAQPATKNIAHSLVTLSPGRGYTLSNAALDTPWPKTVKLDQAVQKALLACSAGSADSDTLERQENSLGETLQRALLDNTPASSEQLPRTGVSQELEKSLSSVFVRHPADNSSYGTRSSLCAVLGRDGKLKLTERSHQPMTNQTYRSLDWSNFMF